MERNLSYLVIVFVILCCDLTSARQKNVLLDWDLYKNVLDSEECARQLSYIRENDTALGFQFMDASWRVPRSILKLNQRDAGNFFQCLNINSNVGEDMQVQGKFCAVRYPTDLSNITLPDMPWPDFGPIPQPGFPTTLGFTEEKIEKIKSYERVKDALRVMFGQTAEQRTGGSALPLPATFELASCIPQVCTAQEAIDFFSRGVTRDMNYEDNFCRLPNDRPWVAVEIVAVVIFSLIGLLTILSTAYEIRHSICLKKDPKEANRLCMSFSMVTNARNLFDIKSGPGMITCLDGIRSFAMTWVIVGHTYASQMGFVPENPLDIINYMTDWTYLWITSAHLTVDTFFLISGLLVVYITASKMTSATSFIKNLHLFYLNRILRMFPVLAVGILLTMSFVHRTIDGPYLHGIAGFAENCRNGWWSVLLYVQNWVHPTNMCLPHSWYLAIDMQLYILSPLVLLFVIGQRKLVAWSVLVGTLVGVTIGASVYNFLNNFPSHSITFRQEPHDYMSDYYINTLARASPFFLGMLLGYFLHLYREKKFEIPMILALVLWVLALSCTTLTFISTYWIVQPDWDNQLVDNMINSYQRLIWSAGVGWIIVACHKGYGGPINWILSLYVFKVFGRLSYAMYIMHFTIIFLTNATTLTPIYFESTHIMYRFIVDYMFTLDSAILVTIFIDMPFANLINIAMGSKKTPQAKRPPSLKMVEPEMGYAKEEPSLDTPVIESDNKIRV